MRIILRLGVPALATFLLAFSGLPSAAAAPQSQGDVSDPISIVNRIAPGLLAQTDKKQGTVPTPRGKRSFQPRPTQPTAHRIAITPNLADDVESSEQGVSVLGAKKSSARTLVQPIENGARIMTVIADKTAPSTYSYALDVPQGTTAKFDADGGLVLHDAHQNILGRFGAPWALDSNGKALKTSYSWSGRTLTQTIEFSPSTVFPVVADPTWSYVVKWYMAYTSVQKVRDTLHNCFNCSFPVEGAPAAFPVPRQSLPLVVAGNNFNCSFNYEYSNYNWRGEMNRWAYNFTALEGHFDGAGSSIGFTFNDHSDDYGNNTHGIVEMSIAGNIENDVGGEGSPLRAAYMFGATSTWTKFQENLAYNTGGAPIQAEDLPY